MHDFLDFVPTVCEGSVYVSRPWSHLLLPSARRRLSSHSIKTVLLKLLNIMAKSGKKQHFFRVDLHCCVNFCHTAERFGYTHTDVLFHCGFSWGSE